MNNPPNSPSTTQHTHCPECAGTTTRSDGEHICTACGLVIDDTQLDHGPEWRAFNSTERATKSRVGAPTTNTIHDNGLSTTIDWADRDGYGNALSDTQRKKMNRLRTWNERIRTPSGTEQGLQFALGEINRIASALGLPNSTRETASMIFRQAQQNNLIPGRSIESVASTALYIAARQEKLPRSLDEFTTVSRVERTELQRTYSYICNKLTLAVPNTTAQQYLPRYSTALNLDTRTEQLARNFLDAYYESGAASGKTATGLAAAAIYAATTVTQSATYSQSDVAAVAEITSATIHNRYKHILEVYAQETNTDL